MAPLAPESWAYFALDNISYHGHDVAIVWDRDGTRYKRGAGLTLLVDGRVVARNPRLARTVAKLPKQAFERAVINEPNIAVNNGHRPYPLITTSYSAPGTSPHWLNDGQIWYHQAPPNRWTTAGSPNATDWVIVDFGEPRRVTQLALYFLDDSVGAKPPASYQIEAWQNGAWGPVAMPRIFVPPTGRQANRIRLINTTTSKLRVTFTPRKGASVGVAEIEAFSTGPQFGSGSAPKEPPTTPKTSSRNLAWGAAVSATFTSNFDKVREVNDMAVAFTRASRNRWTAFGSPNATDWVELALPRAAKIGSVELYLWGDDRGVKAPKRVTIQYWDGTDWRDAMVHAQVPAEPAVSMVNTVTIMPVTTNKVRVRFTHNLPAVSGMTEIRILEAGQ